MLAIMDWLSLPSSLLAPCFPAAELLLELLELQLLVTDPPGPSFLAATAEFSVICRLACLQAW